MDSRILGWCAQFIIAEGRLPHWSRVDLFLYRTGVPHLDAESALFFFRFLRCLNQPTVSPNNGKVVSQAHRAYGTIPSKVDTQIVLFFCHFYLYRFSFQVQMCQQDPPLDVSTRLYHPHSTTVLYQSYFLCNVRACVYLSGTDSYIQTFNKLRISRLVKPFGYL